MKLEKMYKKIVEIGINNDLRGKDEIKKKLKEEKENYKELKKEEKEFYDKDKLFNPFSDSRILYGKPDTEVKKVIIGIDMEVGEILLTHILNQDLKRKIDLVVAHHPEGYAIAKLHEVMDLQADILSQCGISISVAEKLMEKRIGEVERRFLPMNHNRAVDVARVLGIPMICSHTPADNCVTNYLTKLFKRKKPYKLKNILKILKGIEEYKIAARLNNPPKIVNGSPDSKCGKIFVDMTGGTEGSKEVFDKFANSGVSTLVCMHLNEGHLENAKKANLNIVIAGHISSDVIGMNLMFDELEKEERLEFVEVSGFKRVRRGKK